MGKFALIYKCFGLQTRFRIELCSKPRYMDANPLDFNTYSFMIKVKVHVLDNIEAATQKSTASMTRQGVTCQFLICDHINVC
jgi:hypothetical protein